MAGANTATACASRSPETLPNVVSVSSSTCACVSSVPPPALEAMSAPVTDLRPVVALSMSACVMAGRAEETSWRTRLFDQPRIVVPLVAIACPAVESPSLRPYLLL